MLIKIATTPEEIARCFPALSQLRPHLLEDTFVDTVQHLMQTTGYKLAFLSDDEVKAVAGFKLSEWLHTGKYLDLEDLITVDTERSKGYGGLLFDWLCELAVAHQCRQLRLVSAVTRLDAHRFYRRKGMVYEAKYFSLNLAVPG